MFVPRIVSQMAVTMIIELDLAQVECANTETPGAFVHRAVMFCSIAAEGYQPDRDRKVRLRRGKV